MQKLAAGQWLRWVGSWSAKGIASRAGAVGVERRGEWTRGARRLYHGGADEEEEPWEKALDEKAFHASAKKHIVSLKSLESRIPFTVKSETSFPVDLRSEVEQASRFEDRHEGVASVRTMHWAEGHKPRTFLIARKQGADTLSSLTDIARWIGKNLGDDARVLVQPHSGDAIFEKKDANGKRLPIYTYDPAFQKELSRVVDVVICLGGDGSLLHVSSLFGSRPVPPILTISMGTLSFLASYEMSQLEEAMVSVVSGGFSYTNRMRLNCYLERASGGVVCDVPRRKLLNDERNQFLGTAMNEVVLHRGSDGKPIQVEMAVDDQFLTSTVGDGLIVATATGSTGYSLSCGGSMVHPMTQSVMLTPICPISLSFRPIVLPSDVCISMRVPETCRVPGQVSLDGLVGKTTVFVGDKITVVKGEHPAPTITSGGSIQDWVRDINVQLKWNQTPTPKSH